MLTMSACARETPKPSSTAAPVQNVVLITIDTLRADYVSAYGELTLASTPAIDALAGRLIDHFQSEGTRVIVLSEYGIVDVKGPVHVNRVLRQAGLVAVRPPARGGDRGAGATRRVTRSRRADGRHPHIGIPLPQRRTRVSG